MSEFEQDYIMRQIKNIAGALAQFLFHKETAAYQLRSESSMTDADFLFRELEFMLDAGEVNRAENRLFEKLDRDNLDVLEVALDFYAKLDQWEDGALEAAEFTREEVRQGLASVLRFYEVSLEQIVDYFHHAE